MENKLRREKSSDIDHSHETGKVRGLLCHNCNMLLGHSKDNINTLENAIMYLNKSTLQNYGR